MSGGVERAMKVIYTTLKETLPPYITVAQATGFFQPERKEQLPMITFQWRTRSLTWDTRPDHPILVEVVPSTFSFTPKVRGRHAGEASSVLYDPEVDFEHERVRSGDIIRNLTKDTRGTVLRVLPPHNLETDITFEPGDEYDVHWPIDVLKYFLANRESVVEFSIFADPQAGYGTGKTLDEVEHMLESAVWTYMRRRFQKELIEVLDFERIATFSGEVISGVGVASWYDRAVCELRLHIADMITVRVPTIEEVPVEIDLETPGPEVDLEALPDEPLPLGYVRGKLIDP